MRLSSAAAWAVLQLVLSAATPAAQPARPVPSSPAASLAKTILPARGRQETIFSVTRFGRYAVTVKSEQGVSLQLVDRMAGPGAIEGKEGERDGRLDLFLDRGEYKIVARADRKGSGAMTLAARDFTERNTPKPPRLVESKPVEAALDDFTQISWWIEIGKRRPIALEAAGRNLADLRLWKDAGWLVDAEPNSETVQPKVGQPLAVRRLATTLEPGLYLLTAYGGPSQPWAEDSSEHPLYLRFGIPQLAEAGRRRYTVGPFGIDRFLVPGSANTFRIELPEARPAELNVGDYDPESPFHPGAGRAAVTKQSLPPVADLSAGHDPQKLHVVTVTAPAGQPYLLQHFEALSDYIFTKSGNYWLSTIHSGDPADSVDATAIVMRQRLIGDRHDEPLVEQVVELDGKTGWGRRCNLLEPLTVFVHVKAAGKYEILSRGTEARFRFEPFFTYRPPRYEPPDFQRTGSKWDLDTGYYVLTVEPEKKGILDVLVRPVGLLDFVLEKLNLERGSEVRPVRAAAQFPSLALDAMSSYHVFINQQPQVKSGLVLRELPLDLTEALPLALKPGEAISVSFRSAEPGVLRCEGEDGAALDVSVDGGPPGKTATVAVGNHTASVKSALAKTAVVSLELAPVRLAASTPLPAIMDEQLASLPKLPVLTEASPRFFDLSRGEVASFLVNAEKPALYRLETTGLLATAGNLRSRTVTSFLKNAANGVGRNFLIQSFLRTGDYQLSVSPQNPSTGHVGLTLSKTPLAEGGALLNGIPARGELPAGQAIVYTFQIPRAGPYTVKAMGLGHSFRGRLEDKDGWPIIVPNGPADITRRFEAGAYRLVVLPEPVGSRVVTLLQRTPPPLKFAGHGPHKLPLGRRIEHLWMEPAQAEERRPDAWRFEMPAAAETSIELTDEMNGDLLRVGPDGRTEKVAYVPPLSGWKGLLAKGSYRLEAVCLRTSSSLPYRIAVWPEPLLTGLVRDITAPASVPVSVGADGLVELSSFGSTDVRGRLYDAEGRFVAENDDRPGDWNFLLAGRLAAGAYRLQVDPVGAASARTTVTMEVPEEIVENALALPAAQNVSPGRTVHVFPLAAEKDVKFLAVAARSAENVGLSLEVEESGSWRSLGSRVGRFVRLETPARPDAKHRLRLWSVDRRGAPVRLFAFSASPPKASEAQLAGGLALAMAPGGETGVVVAAVAVDKPGLFRVEDGGEGLRACSAAGTLCQDSQGLISSFGGTLFLVKNLSGKAASAIVRAARVVLPPGADHAVIVIVSESRPALCDLAPGRGGPVLVSARSVSGQPGVAVVTGASAAAAPDLRATIIGPRSSMAVALSGARAAARVWAAEGGEALEVRLAQQSFPPPPREKAGWGALDGSLSGVTARAFDLPSGGKRVRLTVGEATVAVLSNFDEVVSVHWAGDERFEETVDGSANRLTLLHTRAAEDRFTVEALPLAAADATPALSPGTPFEHAMERAGWTRLAIPPVADGRPLDLHVRGADGEPLLLSSDGTVARGGDVAVGSSGGTLLIPHGVGPLLAWLDRAGAPGEGLWGDVKAPAARGVTVPAVVTLEGASVLLRLSSTGPVMLHMRSATPVVTRLTRADAPPTIEAYPAGCNLDVYLPAGPAEIGLRALAGRSLWGSAELTSTPVLPTGEGLGPEVLLSAGGTRGFSFTVTRNGPVGIGVRADSDVVNTTLWTAGGQKLGSGVMQMPQLAPGGYVLAIHAPSGSRPISARPALAGLTPPSLDPPDEVILSYVAPPEGASFSATRGARRRVVPQEVPEEEAPAAEEPDEDSDKDDGIERAPHR
jgi:hypothetical protein